MQRAFDFIFKHVTPPYWTRAASDGLREFELRCYSGCSRNGAKLGGLTGPEWQCLHVASGDERRCCAAQDMASCDTGSAQ